MVMREGSVPDLSPWFVDGGLLVLIVSFSMHVCLQISPFQKDTNHIGVGPSLMTPF